MAGATAMLRATSCLILAKEHTTLHLTASVPILDIRITLTIAFDTGSITVHFLELRSRSGGLRQATFPPELPSNFGERGVLLLDCNNYSPLPPCNLGLL